MTRGPVPTAQEDQRSGKTSGEDSADLSDIDSSGVVLKNSDIVLADVPPLLPSVALPIDSYLVRHGRGTSSRRSGTGSHAPSTTGAMRSASLWRRSLPPQARRRRDGDVGPEEEEGLGCFGVLLETGKFDRYPFSGATTHSAVLVSHLRPHRWR